jgi:NADH-quinone oxidoreductase subunit L
VGLCSYLLIGYYYDKPSAREAAKKAFLVNRIGDFGFAIGIMLAFLAFGTVSYFGDGSATGAGAGLLTMATSGDLTPFQQTALDWIPFLLMLGAFGKSAQFPLYVWLPDAMEGPTPVSALIHAATMVTAGVYMIARCGTLFVGNTAAMATIAIVGTFTAIFAASIALRQYDLKKVFAYSTVSQLGFMFAGVGVLAPVAGVFHLVTHAFFKALLFLSSGVVMHAMAGELDMRKMSGLKRVLPQTRWLMLIGCLALAGVVPLSGFWSKDEIVAFTWERHWFLGLMLLVTAFMTAYYTFRLYFRVFAGPEVIPQPDPAHGHGHGHDSHGGHDHDSHGGHGDHGHHNHEPFVMTFPLWILAIGALASGLLLGPTHHLGHFLSQSPSIQMAVQTAVRAGVHVNPMAVGMEDNRLPEIKEADHTLHLTFMVLSTVIALSGIVLAWYFHLKNRAAAERMTPAFARVLDAKYWVDEIYQAGIVEPLRSLGRAFFAFDRIIVDGIVGLIGFIPQLGGFALKLSVQRGYLQGYAAAMLFGIAAILLVIFL